VPGRCRLAQRALASLYKQAGMVNSEVHNIRVGYGED
jgi:hypothetical protein